MSDISKISVDGTSYNLKDTEARALIQQLQDAVYPIGHYIINKNCQTEADVINLYGGNHWVQIKDKFIMSKGDTYTSDGGSATATLSTANLPSHSHGYSGTFTTGNNNVGHSHYFTTDTQGEHYHGMDSTISTGGSNYRALIQTGPSAGYSNTSSTGAHAHSGTTHGESQAHTHNVSISGTTTAVGSASPIDIIPPYLAEYVWRRES